MDDGSFIVRCPQCGTKNRVPNKRTTGNIVCGKCKSQLDLTLLFPHGFLRVNDSSFYDEVIRFNGPVLVDFTAPWGGHCRGLEPVLDELANEYAGKIKFVKVNVDESPRTASNHGIRGVPAFYFYNGGRIVDQAVGALPKSEIERHLNSMAR